MKTDEVSGTLLHLFVEKVRENLRQKILEALKPDIDEALNKAIDELRPQVEAVYDYTQQRILINLLVQNRKPPA